MTHEARAPDALPTGATARPDDTPAPAVPVGAAVPPGRPGTAPARLTRRVDFLRAAKAARAGGAVMTVQAVDRGDAGMARVGLTVSRKNGTATERNRIRRRLREAARQVGTPGFRPGLDYVVIARRGVIDRPFAALIGDLAGAIRRLGKARPAPAAAPVDPSQDPSPQAEGPRPRRDRPR